VRVLAKIPARPSPDSRAGTLRRSDLAAYGELLRRLSGSRSVLVAGEADACRAGAVGLAAAAAAAGTRTALLECELADPGLAEALGLATAPGLHEHLRDAAGSEQILKPVALAGPGSADAVEPLVCVVGGRPAVNVAELLSSERFRRALAGLRDAYELLVVVAPADPGALIAAASECDAVLAWTAPNAEAPALPVSATGLVVQG
jgi:Mrp family chromosome partitioning ATPase